MVMQLRRPEAGDWVCGSSFNMFPIKGKLVGKTHDFLGNFPIFSEELLHYGGQDYTWKLFSTSSLEQTETWTYYIACFRCPLERAQHCLGLFSCFDIPFVEKNCGNGGTGKGDFWQQGSMPDLSPNMAFSRRAASSSWNSSRAKLEQAGATGVTTISEDRRSNLRLRNVPRLSCIFFSSHSHEIMRDVLHCCKSDGLRFTFNFEAIFP